MYNLAFTPDQEKQAKQRRKYIAKMQEQESKKKQKVSLGGKLYREAIFQSGKSNPKLIAG